MSVSLSVPRVQIKLARPFEAEFYSYSITSIGTKIEEGVQSKHSEEFHVNSNHPFEYVTLFHSFDSGFGEEDAQDASEGSIEWSPPLSPSRVRNSKAGENIATNSILSGLNLVKADENLDSPATRGRESDTRTKHTPQDVSQRKSMSSVCQTTGAPYPHSESHHHEEHLNIRSGPPCPPPASLELEEEELGFDRELTWRDSSSSPLLKFTKSVLDIEKLNIVFKLWERVHENIATTEVGSCQFSILPLLRESLKAWPLIDGQVQGVFTRAEEDLCLKLKHRGAVEANCTLSVGSSLPGLHRIPAVL